MLYPATNALKPLFDFIRSFADRSLSPLVSVNAHWTFRMDGICGEIYVNIIDSFYADLSEEDNPLIKYPEDTVKLKIDDVYIRVSKKVRDHSET
ncbi:hypothetical protein L596_013152 [Steinernema carpocapsae]|uniref:Uncharacterized protein n=1 Tax=Steinernema carpocapsae TaxID=34508 RepID=A0A4U5NZ94_STECR|nr:hypothetical protein L596_013152 [Steinernema carpocapsae]